jgi:hypothetical protein
MRYKGDLLGLHARDFTLRRRLGTQPQRDVGGLHSLPHHPHQFLIQRFEVRLISQLHGEGFEGLPGVVLVAVEAAVYEGLNALRRGLNRAAIKRVEATTASVDF